MPTMLSVFFGHAPNPPIEFSSVDALKSYLSISDEEVRVIKRHRSRMYSYFAIPKRRGGVRLIDAPDERLLYLQRRLLKVFEKIYRPRHSVHGFVLKRSAITNAQEHLKRQHVLNLDLKDFFPTISQDRVSGLFRALGIPHDALTVLLAICCVGNKLPQGAPTSPIISNMISLRMDKEFMSFCKTRRIKYSRYADDLTFSTYTNPHQLFDTEPPSPGRLKSNQISIEIRNILANNGFDLNEEKIRYFGPDSRKEVTGLIVSDIVNVPRKFVRNIRAILFDIETRGYPSAQIKFSEQTGKITPLSQHLRGKILWISQVKSINDPVYLRLAKRFNAEFPIASLPIGQSKAEIRDLSNWVLEKDASNPKTASSGSAFFLKSHGLVTAYHCVENAKKIEVFHPHNPSKRYEVTVGKYCKHRDLAVLTHSIPNGEFLELEMLEEPSRVGEKVLILGYPNFGPGSSLQVREAKVVSNQTKSSVRQFVVDGKINQGNSGGPIVDQSDRVIGVAHKGGPGEAIDIAISISEIKLI